jgi:2,4-dienoyl-CoA reductase-like NADH-dependent reductase (Old Yellow Enzyme family)
VSSSLFSPITLRSLTVVDRLWVSPMCQYSAVDGVVNQWHHVHLGAFATGGASLIIVEASSVSPEGRITPGDAGIWNDEQRDAWSGVLSFLHAQGARVAIQLAHAGRKASARIPWHEGPTALPETEGGWETLAPSAHAFGHMAVPAEMTSADLQKLVVDFAAATTRAVEAGFDAIEIHAAHGYLLHEFLSPISNTRTDAYGGDLAGRAKILLEVTEAVRAAMPEGMPLLVRISASDWIEGGWDIDESVELSRMLKELGVDMMDVSSGGLDPSQNIVLGPGYQVPFATRIRNEAGIPVAAVGLITDSAQAESIVKDGLADVVLAGRAFLREPTFARRVAVELGLEARWPSQYLRARNDGR